VGLNAFFSLRPRSARPIAVAEIAIFRSAFLHPVSILHLLIVIVSCQPRLEIQELEEPVPTVYCHETRGVEDMKA